MRRTTLGALVVVAIVLSSLGAWTMPAPARAQPSDAGPAGALIFRTLLPLIMVTSSRPVASTIWSDDFNRATLNPGWEFVNPRGDATLTLDGTRAIIAVPAGTAHAIWSDGKLAPRIRQPVTATSWDMTVKFTSLPHNTYDQQGIIVESPDEGDFLRFELYSRNDRLYAYVASFDNLVPNPRLSTLVNPGPTPVLKVRRNGDEWEYLYSPNGQQWSSVISFTQSISTSTVGVYAGNDGSSPPAFAAEVDYVFNTSTPIANQDSNPEVYARPPQIADVTFTPGATSANVSFTTDQIAVGQVEYGETPAYGSVSSTSATGQSHQLTLQGLKPQTIYFIRAVAANSNGYTDTSPGYVLRTGAPQGKDPAIDVWYGDDQSFGQRGSPQMAVNILGRVSDADGVASLSYRLNGGPAQTLSQGPDGRRLQARGDFNVDLDATQLMSGANTLAITAIDTVGNTSTREVTVRYTAGQVWPLPYSANWSTMTLSEAVQVVDGMWARVGDGVRTVEPGYDRILAVGDTSWRDYELSVSVTINGFRPADATSGHGVGIVLRWKGHSDWDGSQPRYGWYPLGAAGWYKSEGDYGNNFNVYIWANNSEVIASEQGRRKLYVGQRYWFKLRVLSQTGTTSLYHFKVWKDGDPEPQEWDLTTQGHPQELATGSALLVAHNADVTFGDVTIVPLSP